MRIYIKHAFRTNVNEKKHLAGTMISACCDGPDLLVLFLFYYTWCIWHQKPYNL